MSYNLNEEQIALETRKYKDRKEIINWLKTSNTKYMVTITFNDVLSELSAEIKINKLLNRVKKEFFNNNYAKRYFKGVAIKEYQARQIPHYHILIEYNKVFDKKNKDFKEIIRKKAEGLYANSRYDIHPRNGIFVDNYYEGKLEEYLTKRSYTDPTFGFINPIDYSGVLWNDSNHII